MQSMLLRLEENIRNRCGEDIPLDSVVCRLKKTQNLHDYLGIRIITRSQTECFLLAKIIKDNFEVLEGRYRDYISKPWNDGYQSIHIDIVFEGIPAEIQIRTSEMDFVSQNLIQQKGKHYWRVDRSEIR